MEENKIIKKNFSVTLGTNPLVSVLGNVTYKQASAPPLTEPEGHEYFCDSPDSDYCKEHAADRTPCSCTHVQNVPLNSIVEVIIYDKSKFFFNKNCLIFNNLV